MCGNLNNFDLSRKQIEELIDQWIFNERDRAIARRRFLDGVRFEKLAEEFQLSTQQAKSIIYKTVNKITQHI